MKTFFDKNFNRYIDNDIIVDRINSIANNINRKYKNEKVVFVGVLNGSFMFFADLIKKIDLDCEIEFIKVSSYQGDSSTGIVNSHLDLIRNIENENIILIEDIIDSGLTVTKIIKDLQSKNPKSIEIATLLFKKDAFIANFEIDYIGFEIENKFVIGYGLDFDQKGRNLSDIYILQE